MDEFGLKTTFHRLSPWAVLLVASCTSLAGIEDPVPRPDEGAAGGGVPSGGSSSSSGAGGDEGFAGSFDIDDIGLGGSDGLRDRGDGGSAGEALGGSAGDAGGGGAASPPECQADELRCDVYQPQHCAAGRWEDFGAPCPLACVDGACQSPPSCGPSNTAPCVDGVSCCETIWVPGGDYEMGKASSYEPDAHFPRHVSGFYLDRFEVTVGRFSVFKDLYRLPAQGAGRHPLFANSGCQEAWEALQSDGKSIVPKTGAELLDQISTQCPEAGRTWGNVDTLLPANCVNWYVAFAFCAWDGGRLPTEAEWNYAAAHGDAARPYPWSVDENDTGFGPTNAAFNTELAEPLLAPVAVGSFPAGRGGFFRYPGRGHDDLGGNVVEWTLDQWTDTPADSCTTDCYEPWTENEELRSARGGAFASPYDDVRTGNRAWLAASTIDVYFGFRCARDINTHPE